MRLINEVYKPIDDLTNSYSHLFWLYLPDRVDFFLRRYDTWYNLHTETYILRIDGHDIRVPANFFMVIGDYDAGLDTITPDDICGREFEVLTFNLDMEPDSWLLKKVTVVGHEDESLFQLPFTKNAYPVAYSDERAILISSVEIYGKIKNLTFSDII